MTEQDQESLELAFQDLVETLEETAKTRLGLGQALRSATEVATSLRGSEVIDQDTGNYDGKMLLQNLEVLAGGFRSAVLALRDYDGVPDVDVRVRRLLVELIEITVGEGDDLTRMVNLQVEARALLTGES